MHNVYALTFQSRTIIVEDSRNFFSFIRRCVAPLNLKFKKCTFNLYKEIQFIKQNIQNVDDGTRKPKKNVKQFSGDESLKDFSFFSYFLIFKFFLTLFWVKQNNKKTTTEEFLCNEN